MSSKEKKVKSSKGDDRKQKKTDEVTIVVDRSNAESTVSPTKPESNQNGDTLTANEDQQQLESNERKPTEDEVPQQLDEKPLSDATKLTEILIERLVHTISYCHACKFYL